MFDIPDCAMAWSMQNHWEKSNFTPAHMRTEEVLARELQAQKIPPPTPQNVPVETFVVPAEKLEEAPTTKTSMFDISNDLMIIILLVVVALLLLRGPRHHHPPPQVILLSR